MKVKFYWLLIAIFILALTARFYRIGSVPRSLNWDETTFGYSAYSLLLTGKDEWGATMPLQLRSIGDYKNPMYAYLTVLPVKLFGLSEFSVRLAPAVLGSLAVLMFTLTAWKFLGNKKLALWAGLMLAVSPWQLQFTRAGADVGVSTFFTISGITLILFNKPLSAAMMLAGSMYSYFSDKLFVPMLLPFLVRKRKVLFLAVFLLLSLGSITTYFSAGHKGKIFMTTLLSYRTQQETIDKLRAGDSPLLYRIFHNDWGQRARMFADRFFNHFSPSFLFAEGPQDNRQRIWKMGMMYWPEFILLAGALVFADRLKIKNKRLLVIWTILAVIPSVITKDAVHARRAINLVYPLMIWAAATGGYILSITPGKLRKVVAGGYFLIWILAIGFYLCSYYVWTPIRTAKGSGGWQYGYKQLVNFVTPIASEYSQIIVDPYYQGPFSFFLFYQKYPPAKYQAQAKLIISDELSLGESPGFDKYLFRTIYWPNDRSLKNTLFAGPPERLPEKDIDGVKAKLLKIIYFPDGEEAWVIVETI